VNPLNNPNQQDRLQGMHNVVNNLINQPDPILEKMDNIPDYLKPYSENVISSNENSKK
jgi:hypothetical protein